MFGSLGVPEMILIFIVALLVFGPKRLPEIGRTLGKALGEFKKATDDFKSTIEREVRVEELKQLASTQVPVIDTVSRSEPVPPPVVTTEPAEAPRPAHDPAEPMTAEQMAALSAAPAVEPVTHD